MKAMILAAGRGERMRPLTDTCPKPLRLTGGEPLIGWHLHRLKAAGFTEIVINHAWLGAKIEAALGSGAAYGVRIAYSPEGEKGLETAGGIATALPLLGDAPFIALNGDIHSDYPIARLIDAARTLDLAKQAHLVLVPYPGHKAGAALALAPDDRVTVAVGAPYTFAGLAAYHPALFAELPRGEKRPLLPLFEHAGAAGHIRGEVHHGAWTDVGTPERLAELDRQLAVRD